MSVPIMAFCERIGRKKLTPRFGNGKKWSLWGIICIISTSVMTNYMIQPFQLLAWDWAIENWKNYFFGGHIICIVFYLMVSNMPTHKVKET